MKVQYDKITDAVVYGETTKTFGRADWVRLALAAADQASLLPSDGALVVQAVVNRPRGLDSSVATAADEVRADPSNEAFRAAQHAWQSMYLGAFMALTVSNGAMAKELASLTRSDDEAINAIRRMRDAAPGDRVYPALEWLRGLRKGAP